MKKILFITTLLCLSIVGNSFSQVFSSYGHTNNYRQITTKTPLNVTKVNGFDTLSNVDTGYLQFGVPNSGNLVVDLFASRISGTQAGVAVLMGSTQSTMPTPTSTTWQILTGNTAICAGCAGASATVTGTGTTQYTWHVLNNTGNYQNYQVRVITSGTVTGTYTGQALFKN